jgi:hypothetical protein
VLSASSTPNWTPVSAGPTAFFPGKKFRLGKWIFSFFVNVVRVKAIIDPNRSIVLSFLPPALFHSRFGLSFFRDLVRLENFFIPPAKALFCSAAATLTDGIYS